MKTRVVIAALILMIGVVQVNANVNGPSLTISHQDGSGVFLVKYHGSQTGDIKMTIKDNLGRVLITKSIRGVSAFSLPVDLKNVDAGVYVIEVDNGKDKQIQTLDYSDQSSATLSHVTSLGDKRYLLSITHAGSENIYIRILNDAGNPDFEEVQSINGDFAKVYDLKSVVGNPTFEISDPSRSSLITK